MAAISDHMIERDTSRPRARVQDYVPETTALCRLSQIVINVGMLDYLVTSSVRRRLLALLWSQGARGSVRELADSARVAYAGAYRELREMVRQGLATATVEHGVERYAAAVDHPDADVMRRLLTPRPRSTAPRDERGETARRQLRALGAPLPVDPVSVAPDERERVLVAGVELARRDPTVARVLPLVLWKQRDALNRERLELVARRSKEKHAVGFMLALTGELAGDRKLTRLAEQLRDRRVKRVRPFFELPATRSAEATALRRTPELARKWGYSMNLDMDSFRSQFEKFRNDAAV